MVFWGLALRAYLGLKHRHMAHFWEGVGYLGGLSGILALAASYLGNLQAGWLSASMYLGFGVFLLAVLMSRIWLMLPEIFTQAGHILSHIRIYAVGAAGGSSRASSPTWASPWRSGLGFWARSWAFWWRGSCTSSSSSSPPWGTCSSPYV